MTVNHDARIDPEQFHCPRCRTAYDLGDGRTLVACPECGKVLGSDEEPGAPPGPSWRRGGSGVGSALLLLAFLAIAWAAYQHLDLAWNTRFSPVEATSNRFWRIAP